MKNYRLLVPILLIAMFLASIYMLNSTKQAEIEEYNAYLEAARDYRAQDIQVDAEANYLNALEVKSSLSLYLEIGEFYTEAELTKKAIQWGETILDEYPKEPSAYEFQMQLLISRRDYVSCFELAEEFESRKLKSKKMTELIASIEYEFYFNGEYEDVGVFSSGCSPVLKGDKWGYVNTTGKKSVSAVYAKVGAFYNGLAPVVDKDGNAFYIDTSGNKKFVIQGIENVVELGIMYDGVYSLYNGQYWAFYDDDYNYLFGEYDNASAIGNGVAAVEQNGKWSLVDTAGKDLTGEVYTAVAMDEKQIVYRNGRLFVNNGSGYRMIDVNGTVYGDEIYQDACIFNDSTYAAVKIDGKWGFIDSSGKLVIEPQYQDARSFSNGLAAVMLDGKWGFIDENGTLVIQPQFEDAKDFNDHGCVFVSNGEEWELLRLYKANY